MDKTEGLPGRIRDLITLIDNRESESTMKIFESTNNESFSAFSKQNQAHTVILEIF